MDIVLDRLDRVLRLLGLIRQGLAGTRRLVEESCVTCGKARREEMALWNCSHEGCYVRQGMRGLWRIGDE